ncbi:MAG: outer membrane protein assembly factor, partial [Bacteroidota bacterium]
NDLLLESVLTFRYQDWFWKIQNQFRYYHRIGRKGNLATRVRLGISPDINSPFVPFVLDSYLNIRGSGNRVARGTGEIVWNGEYRHTLWEDGRYGAIQVVGFVDWGTWRTLDIKGRDMFRPENMVLFYGGGIRLYIPKASHLILRADYGFRAGAVRENGLVLGVGQYF